MAAMVIGVNENNTIRSNAPTRQRKEAAPTAEVNTIEKDATELRLEQVLFGDDNGFLDALHPQANDTQALVQRPDSKDGVNGSDNDDDNDDDVADDELFFLDADASNVPVEVRNQLDMDVDKDLEEANGGGTTRQAVWHDSDDDRVAISLAANPRLRKLRDTLDDDIVSGREYVARLRRQYERLHPTPEWATLAHKRKRRSEVDTKASSTDDSDMSLSDSDNENENHHDGNTYRSVQPLAALLSSAGSLTRQSGPSKGLKRRKLQAEVINISRLPPVTSSGPSSVDSLHFHPYYPILLASGPSATASLYHISPQPPNPNPLLTSLHVTKTALRHSEFCVPATSSTAPQPDTDSAASDGTRIFLSSRRRYFHIWSLATGRVTKVSRALSTISHQQKTTERFKISPCGKYLGLVSSTRAGGGNINVLDAVTMSWICACRIDSQGGIADFDWWGVPPSSPSSIAAGFTVVGKSGQAAEYSVVERRTIARWQDEGAVGSTVVATSRDGRWTAIGSSAGIVNIYDRHSPDFKQTVLAQASANTDTESEVVTASALATAARPQPTRTLDQLTTPISHLVFSPDSQLLVVSSRWKKNALRLVHLPSCTVFRNWPTDSTSLGRISSVAVGVSPTTNGAGSGALLLAVGNERGAIRLWEIGT